VGLLVVINILESKRVNTKIQAESYRCRVLKQSETGNRIWIGIGIWSWKLQRTSNVGEEETPALSRRHPSPWSPRAVRLAAPEGAGCRAFGLESPISNSGCWRKGTRKRRFIRKRAANIGRARR
jgi:hypothetical protein